MANWLYKRSVASREVATDYAQGGYQLVASADADFSGLELACIGSAGTILWKKRITGMYEQVVVRGDSASSNFYVAFRDADSVQFWRILRIAAATGVVVWEKQYTDTAADQVDLGSIVLYSGTPIVIGTGIYGTASWVWIEKLSSVDGSSIAGNKANCTTGSTPLIGRRGSLYNATGVSVDIIGALNSSTPFRIIFSASTLNFSYAATYDIASTGTVFDALNLPSITQDGSNYTHACYGRYSLSFFSGEARVAASASGSIMCASGSELFIATPKNSTTTSINGLSVSAGGSTSFNATHSYTLTGGANHSTANPQDICVGESGIVTGLLTGTTAYTGEVWVMSAPITYDASKSGTYSGLEYGSDTPPTLGSTSTVTSTSVTWTTGSTPFAITAPTTTIATSTATDSISTLAASTSGSVAKNLPSPMVSAFTGVISGVINGVVAITLPKITGALTAAKGYGPEAILPSLTASITASNPTVIGQLGGVLPKPLGACAGEMFNFGTTASSMPKLTAVAGGYFMTTIVLTGTLPGVTNELTGTAGGEGYADSVLPQLSGILEGGSQRNEPVLPRLRGALSGCATTLGAIEAEVARITAVIRGVVATVASLGAMLPRPTGNVDAVVAPIGGIAASARSLSGVLSGTAGTTGNIVVRLPEPTAVLTGSAAVRAVLAARLPRLTSAFPMYRFYQHVLTHVMNTHTTAVTTFENYPFNSFAKIGDKYYGAGPSGLYEIDSEPTDAVAAIPWRMLTGQLDFGSAMQKRLSDFYIAMRSAGDVALTVAVDEQEPYEYSLQATDIDRLKQRKVLLGKGLRGRYWQFGLSGTDDFDMDAYSMTVLDTARRI